MNANFSPALSSTLSVKQVAMMDATLYRQAMAQLAAAVHVITTDGVGGRAGFTATAVCSVSDQPPTLLVCLNRKASIYNSFKQNQVLCVNTLNIQQQQLSNVFGGKTPMAERFSQGQWSTLVTQAPVLEDALINFDCEIKQSVSMGSHDVLFCEVKAIRQKEQHNALLYFRRSYCELQHMCQ
jgi:flavin reductase